MSHKPKHQGAVQDDNRFPALTGHSGTAGTAEVRRAVVTNGELHTRAGGQIPSSGGTATLVYDFNSVEFLESIDNQLKIMNAHLSRITDDDLDQTDIDEGVI